MIFFLKCFQAYFGRRSPDSVAEVRQGFEEFVAIDLKSVCTCFVLDDYWSGMGVCPISYQMISSELVTTVSGSKYQINVMTNLKYPSHSKVELLYLFKRHISDLLL